MLYGICKRMLPTTLVKYRRELHHKRFKARKRALPVLTEEMLNSILINDLGLENGDVVFIHSSIDQLNLGFPFYRILSLVRRIIGEQGTMVFPTYPELLSYDFLARNEVFDVRKTPSSTGILTEFARKQKDAVRSLHPTKSVCALGKYAEELVNTHHESPYPYDSCSPYYKIMAYNGKIIGLGVKTNILSFVHCIDDALKEQLPIETYHKELFHARVIDYNGNMRIVDSYAHNIKRMNHNIPRFIASHVPEEICKDLTIHGMNFYMAKSCGLFDVMLDLAKKHVTIYPKKSYKRRSPS